MSEPENQKTDPTTQESTSSSSPPELSSASLIVEVSARQCIATKRRSRCRTPRSVRRRSVDTTRDRHPGERSDVIRCVARPADATRSDGRAGAFYYGRRKKRGNEICQILIRNGDVSPDKMYATALKLQEERGGQIGRILVSDGGDHGACASREGSSSSCSLRGNPEANLSLAARAESRDWRGCKVRCSPFLTTITASIAARTSWRWSLAVGPRCG